MPNKYKATSLIVKHVHPDFLSHSFPEFPDHILIIQLRLPNQPTNRLHRRPNRQLRPNVHIVTIHIFSAYFGIQSSTPSQCVAANANGTSSDCFNKVVFDNINATCEGQNSCSLDIRIENFGDPCFLLDKQLFLQYQCIDSSVSSLINSCPGNGI